jgi:hypothetical protein
MSEGQSISSEQAARSPSRGAANEVVELVILFNVVTGDIGGLYRSTQSLAVTTIGAGLVALLGLYVVLSRRNVRVFCTLRCPRCTT